MGSEEEVHCERVGPLAHTGKYRERLRGIYRCTDALLAAASIAPGKVLDVAGALAAVAPLRIASARMGASPPTLPERWSPPRS
jgi:hypothetical protein